MATYVQHDTLGRLKFPDGMSKEDMANAIVQAEAEHGEQYGAGETFVHQAGRSTGSSLRQIGDWLGLRDDYQRMLDEREEYKSRVMLEQSPATSMAGLFGGAVFDPVTLPAWALKPLTFSSKVGTFAARGATQGMFGGALEPVYDQYGDSVVANIMVGGALGGGLGAGIGKLVSLGDTKTPAAKSESLKETSEQAIEDVANSVPTVDSALAKIHEEVELQARGALPEKAITDLETQRSLVEADKARLDTKIENLNKAKAAGVNVKAIDAAIGKATAERITITDNLNSLNTKLAEAQAGRKAVKTLEALDNQQWSSIEGFQEMLQAKLAPKPDPITKIVQEVSQRQPTPLNPNAAQKLGFETRQSVGAAGSPLAERVGRAMLPQGSRHEEKVTRELAEGKYTGKNPEARTTVKQSTKVREAKRELDAKIERGEELTEADYRKMVDIEDAGQMLEEYKVFLQKLTSAHKFDTAALRGLSKGRHSFDNLEKFARQEAKKLGIEDFEDMVGFIEDNKHRILDGYEMEILTPLFIEAEKKLFSIHRLLQHSDSLDDATIAVIHSDINMFYGIQAFSKGQGTRLANAFNQRRKMLQDVAEDRMIDSLFLGIKC